MWSVVFFKWSAVVGGGRRWSAVVGGENTHPNDKVILVNKSIKQSLMQRHNVTYWHHYGLWKNIQSLLEDDKVHLNPEGMHAYAKNVRAAVGSTKRS